MYSVWQSVQVIKEEHPRKGQAGTVFATSPEHPSEVVVQFDTDGQRESVPVADIKGL